MSHHSPQGTWQRASGCFTTAQFQAHIFDANVGFSACRVADSDGPGAEAVVGSNVMNKPASGNNISILKI